jgi:hypothetical protein
MVKALNVISLGVELDDERLGWGSVLGDQTVLGHDLVLMRIGPVLHAFRQGEVSFGEREQVQGVVRPAPQARGAMERALHKRRRELDELLKQGKTLVVFVTTPEQCAVPGHKEEKTDETTGAKTTVHMHEARSTLEQVLPIEVSVESLRGDAFRLATTGPFAEFWTEWAPIFHHEAVITEHPGITAVQIADTKKAVAAIVHKGPGLILLLPAFDDFQDPDKPAPEDGPNPAHQELVDALSSLAAQLRGEEELPDWAKEIALPGERKARVRLNDSEGKVEHWKAETTSRAEVLRVIERRKGLVTASGAALEALAHEAFAALGFTLETPQEGRADSVLRLGKRAAVVEIKGQKGSAKEQDAAQLYKWVAAYYADHGEDAKGLLLVNAFHQTPLSKRKRAAFPNQMLKFAVDQQQFCLITGEQLLALWLKADAEPRSRKTLAESLLDCTGIFDGEGLAAHPS